MLFLPSLPLLLERAEHLKRRKEIYEAKYPTTKRPQGGRRPKNSEIISPFSEVLVRIFDYLTFAINPNATFPTPRERAYKWLHRPQVSATHRTSNPAIVLHYTQPPFKKDPPSFFEDTFFTELTELN